MVELGSWSEREKLLRQKKQKQKQKNGSTEALSTEHGRFWEVNEDHCE